MFANTDDTPNNIARCMELAILLEISAHKPGNVSVVTDFENTRYEHFLASAVVASRSFETAARQGVRIGKDEIPLSDAGVGLNIKTCVFDINTWQHGGNTLLGTIILLTPIAVAAGMIITKSDAFDIATLRKNLKLVVESTTPEDAVNVYEAINIAKPSGLGKAPDLDVNNPESMYKIRKEKVSLFQVFKIAEKYDAICSEWVNDFHITFDVAYPFLAKQIKGKSGIDKAIIETFLEILAAYPDTFIARKAGFESAKQVSLRTEEILRLGGLKTDEGQRSLRLFDRELRESGNLLNPGTTADIVAAAISLCVLSGYRP